MGGEICLSRLTWCPSIRVVVLASQQQNLLRRCLLVLQCRLVRLTSNKNTMIMFRPRRLKLVLQRVPSCKLYLRSNLLLKPHTRNSSTLFIQEMLPSGHSLAIPISHQTSETASCRPAGILSSPVPSTRTVASLFSSTNTS